MWRAAERAVAAGLRPGQQRPRRSPRIGPPDVTGPGEDGPRAHDPGSPSGDRAGRAPHRHRPTKTPTGTGQAERSCPAPSSETSVSGSVSIPHPAPRDMAPAERHAKRSPPPPRKRREGGTVRAGGGGAQHRHTFIFPFRPAAPRARGGAPPVDRAASMNVVWERPLIQHHLAARAGLRTAPSRHHTHRHPCPLRGTADSVRRPREPYPRSPTRGGGQRGSPSSTSIPARPLRVLGGCRAFPIRLGKPVPHARGRGALALTFAAPVTAGPPRAREGENGVAAPTGWTRRSPTRAGGGRDRFSPTTSCTPVPHARGRGSTGRSMISAGFARPPSAREEGAPPKAAPPFPARKGHGRYPVRGAGVASALPRARGARNL